MSALQVPAFIVIGGGEIGAGYVRQLLRAAAKGRLVTERILVVDRDPACAAAAFARQDPRVGLEAADWSAWLDAHLAGHGAEDQLVPYHWAPHLLAGWLERQMSRRGARVGAGPPIPRRGIPVRARHARRRAGAVLRDVDLSAGLHRAGAVSPHARGQGLEPGGAAVTL